MIDTLIVFLRYHIWYTETHENTTLKASHKQNIGCDLLMYLNSFHIRNGTLLKPFYLHYFTVLFGDQTSIKTFKLYLNLASKISGNQFRTVKGEIIFSFSTITYHKFRNTLHLK